MPTPSNKAIRYFGDYVLFGKIAEGGMGEVWYARQQSLDRPVAVKLIRAGTLATPADVARFRVEAQAAARLGHKNIVQVFEVGEHEGRHFFSMELIEGSSLAGQIQEGLWRCDSSNTRQRHRDMGTLLATVARAVHHAHQRGVLHRDIKPANILLDEQLEPHLSDFGLAKLLDAQGNLTRSGAVLGTLGYMSPEQAAGQSAEATTASDIYSLGAVLYELLCGRPPFAASTLPETLRQVVEDDPAPPWLVRRSQFEQARRLPPNSETRRPEEVRIPKSESGFDAGARRVSDSEFRPSDLDIICLKCLEKEPAGRYATAEALAEDLDRWLRGEPIRARPAGDVERCWKWVRRHPVTAGLSAALALALLLGLAATTWQWRRVERQRSLTAAALARSQLQRAEDFFASEKAYLALPILARVLRDDPANRVAQERLVNALNHRAFLAPVGPPSPGSSAEMQLTHRIARTADGTLAATATNEDATSIQLENVRSGAFLRRVPNAHSNVIRGLAFRHDGRRLVSASADGTAKIWDTDSSGLLAALPHPAAVHSAEFSPDGKRVLTACRDGIARLWNAESGELSFALPMERSALNVARFDSDGGRIATGADDGRIQLWTISSNSFGRLSEPLALPHAVWDLEFRPHTLVATLDDGATHTLLWTHPAASRSVARGTSDPSSNASPTAPPQPITMVLGRPATNFHSSPITSTNLSPDGRLLATASLDHTARLWDTRRLVPTTEPLVHDAPVNGVRFSADGLRVVTSTPGNIVRVWDAESGQPLTDWIALDQPVAHVAFSPAGTRLETSSGETWPVHFGHEAAPLWLPELAEAIGGSRLDRLGRAEPATPLAVMRLGLTRPAETNALSLWAKQLLESP